MTIPLITALPADPPSTADPSNFDARADALLGALPDMVTEENAAIAAMNAAITQLNLDIAAIANSAAVAADAAGMLGSSTTTLSVGAGNKDITLQAAKPNLLTSGRRVVLVLKSDPTVRMFGNVEPTPTPTSTTARIAVTSGGVFGAGSYGSWDVMAASFFQAAATKLEMWAGLIDSAAVSPESLRLAAEFQTLTEAEAVAGWPTATKGFNAKVTLTANRVIGAPTGLQDGVTYTFQPIQGGSGSYTLSWNSIWDFGVGGAPTLSTTVGKEDKIVAQYNSARTKLEASFRKAG